MPSAGARLWALRGLLLLGSVVATIVLAEFSFRLTPEVSWHEQIERFDELMSTVEKHLSERGVMIGRL